MPSGHLYARLMSHMSLETYDSIIGTLKRAGLVEERNHLLRWLAPRGKDSREVHTAPAASLEKEQQMGKKTSRKQRTQRMKAAKATRADLSGKVTGAAQAADVDADVKKVFDSTCIPTTDRADSSQMPPAGEPVAEGSAPSAAQEQKHMILTLKDLTKNGKSATYSGALFPIRFRLTVFPNRTAPATIEVADGAFAPAREKKAKLTKEERAALPKPTLAEKIARREAALARDKAKLAAETAQPAM